MNASAQLPIIDVGPLRSESPERSRVAGEIRSACEDVGFFYVTGHGVDEQLQIRLEELSRLFFAQDIEAKLAIEMSKGGRAWRGYFPVGAELTSGNPDLKEGLYFGAELDPSHPLVKARTPMHGPNLFPSSIPAMRETVLEYMSEMKELGHAVMTGIALSLGLDQRYFADRYTADPLILFRIFNYPPGRSVERESWGVGEHTDYGVLTMLKQDSSGGLQVKSRSGWIDAPPIAGSFICNIGDMLDRMTGGRYRSTPHRVKNTREHNRLSFPFFFDPNFNAEVKPIETGRRVSDDLDERWDRASVHELSGTYGDYLLGKVTRVFPQLRREVL
ncbi:MAG TPA: 2-oxoglutarate and iron-dependent oxygenase domain-containing protein [Blastocatellia bacterium]|nr:2-oxoglutarate and iron-dependent oxygenase domain-containing protein [Blastocatellia bacterium]